MAWAGSIFDCPSRDSVTRSFLSGFCCESSSPKPLKIKLGSFQIFSEILEDIRKSRCITGVNYSGSKFAARINDTGGKFATGTAGVFDTSNKFATVGK